MYRSLLTRSVEYSPSTGGAGVSAWAPVALLPDAFTGHALGAVEDPLQAVAWLQLRRHSLEEAMVAIQRTRPRVKRRRSRI